MNANKIQAQMTSFLHYFLIICLDCFIKAFTEFIMKNISRYHGWEEIVQTTDTHKECF